MKQGKARDRLAPGSLIDRYVVVGHIGSGGMADVYEAYHTELQKRVAVKVLRAELSSDQQARDRFLSEGRNAALIRHPNVVDVYDVGVHEGRSFLVMEYLDGCTLTRYQGGQRLDVDEAVSLLLPVIAGVSAGHDAGIVHGDVKPDNIFLVKRRGRRNPRLLDFGISRRLGTGASESGSAPGFWEGTPEYLSPEQACGVARSSEFSDQYAVAAVLYEMLLAQRLYPKVALVEDLLMMVRGGRFPRPRQLRANLNPHLERVLLTALSRDPRKRFSSMRTFGRALLSFAPRSAWDEWSAELFDDASPTDRKPVKSSHTRLRATANETHWDEDEPSIINNFDELQRQLDPETRAVLDGMLGRRGQNETPTGS